MMSATGLVADLSMCRQAGLYMHCVQCVTTEVNDNAAMSQQADQHAGAGGCQANRLDKRCHSHGMSHAMVTTLLDPDTAVKVVSV